MRGYQPASPPIPVGIDAATDLQLVVDGVWKEFYQLQGAWAENEQGLLTVRSVAPTKPRQGQLVFADRTNWNPTVDGGLVLYDGSRWKQVMASPATLTNLGAGGFDFRVNVDFAGNYLSSNPQYACSLQIGSSGFAVLGAPQGTSPAAASLATIFDCSSVYGTAIGANLTFFMQPRANVNDAGLQMGNFNMVQALASDLYLSTNAYSANGTVWTSTNNSAVGVLGLVGGNLVFSGGPATATLSAVTLTERFRVSGTRPIVGVGGQTLAAWSTAAASDAAYQVGPRVTYASVQNTPQVSGNAYWDGAAWQYLINGGGAINLSFTTGTSFIFRYAAAGSGAITWVTAAQIMLGTGVRAYDATGATYNALQGTTTTTATAGAQSLPANPAGFMVFDKNGTSVRVPYYNP